MLTNYSEEAIMNLVNPLWFNTYWVKNALEQFQVISKYTSELSKTDSQFWILTQKFSLDGAVIGLCKIYDKSTSYNKHAMPELIKFIKENFSAHHISNIQIDSLVSLKIKRKTAEEIKFSLYDNEIKFLNNKNRLFSAIGENIPKYKKDDGTPLERLFKFRDKIAAHQEQLDDALQEQVNLLPSIEKMEELNELAMNFCNLFVQIFTGKNITKYNSTWMKTIAVIRSVLGDKFNEEEEMTINYRRNT